MPEQLTTSQLEAVQRLISEPLRLAVRVEMQAGHERLASAIEKVADQLARHVAEVVRQDRIRENHLENLEHRVLVLERFRAKMLIVYGALAVVFSVAWSVVWEWIVSLTRKR